MRIRPVWIYIIVTAMVTVGQGQTTQPTSAPSDPSTPKGALKALALALDAGDQERIRSLMNVTSPMEQKMVQATSEMAGAIADLKHAMASKFGEPAAQSAMGDSPDVLQKSLETIESAQEKVDGDVAMVRVSASSTEAMSLKKVSGSWKISVDQQVKDQGLTPQQVDEKMAMVSAQSKMLQDVTGEVTAGKYATAADAAAALRTRMSGIQETTAPTAR